VRFAPGSSFQGEIPLGDFQESADVETVVPLSRMRLARLGDRTRQDWSVDSAWQGDLENFPDRPTREHRLELDVDPSKLDGFDASENR
jgi:hypothetical protein